MMTCPRPRPENLHRRCDKQRHIARYCDGEGPWRTSWSTDQTVRLWDVADPSRHVEIDVLTGHSGGVAGLAFNPAKRVLAAASTGGTVHLWHV
jgi:WD40 repeat protein